MQRIRLLAPSGLPIVAALQADRSVHEVEYLRDETSRVGIYVLEGRRQQAEPTLLVDAAGYRWSPREVEWYTLFARRDLAPLDGAGATA